MVRLWMQFKLGPGRLANWSDVGGERRWRAMAVKCSISVLSNLQVGKRLLMGGWEESGDFFFFCNSRKRNSWKCMWDEEKVGIITICKLIKKQNSFGSRLAQVWILASCLCDFRQYLALCLLNISCYCLNVNF